MFMDPAGTLRVMHMCRPDITIVARHGNSFGRHGLFPVSDTRVRSTRERRVGRNMPFSAKNGSDTRVRHVPCRTRRAVSCNYGYHIVMITDTASNNMLTIKV